MPTAVTWPVTLTKSLRLPVVAFVVVLVVTVTLGASDSVPLEFANDSPVLKSILMLMGVLAVSVSGNGAVEIVTEVGLNAGASVQVVVFEVAGGQEVVPSVNVVVELFRIVAEAFAKVIIMLLKVPASALVFARSSFMVCRFERFTVTGLDSSDVELLPVMPCKVTPVT